MKILSVDFQFDFSRPGGRFYKPRPCVQFLHQIFLPYLSATNQNVTEIISDYRLPRPSENEAYCVPGSWGYRSEIPIDLVNGNRWIKAMNSPSWTRLNAGDSTQPTTFPFCASDEFGEWLLEHIGRPNIRNPIVLIGLTLDCCILSTAQELYYRGYPAFYLAEAVDTYNGTSEEKELLFKTPLKMWGKAIKMNEINSI